jgi:hypothetical protein
MRIFRLLACSATLFLATGCHSPYIEATVTNGTGRPIELLEVDYPSASFGTQDLAPGGTFHYRFKVLGSGPTKLLYTDAAHTDHTSKGPAFKEGDEGQLTIRIQAGEPNLAFVPSAHH